MAVEVARAVVERQLPITDAEPTAASLREWLEATVPGADADLLDPLTELTDPADFMAAEGSHRAAGPGIAPRAPSQTRGPAAGRLPLEDAEWLGLLTSDDSSQDQLLKLAAEARNRPSEVAEQARRLRDTERRPPTALVDAVLHGHVTADEATALLRAEAVSIHELQARAEVTEHPGTTHLLRVLLARLTGGPVAALRSLVNEPDGALEGGRTRDRFAADPLRLVLLTASCLLLALVALVIALVLVLVGGA